jgi:hypothetical protein
MKLFMHDILRHLRRQLGERLGSVSRRRQVERPLDADRFRHRLRDQGFERGHAERGEHGPLVGRARPIWREEKGRAGGS